MAFVLCAAGVLAAQELWYKTYDDAVSAYQRKDYATAAQKFKASMEAPNAPAVRDRGPDVVRVSQQRGFMPDYYLALIYAQLKQWQDVINYAAVTRGYRRLPDRERAEMSAAISQANAALGSRTDQGSRRADLIAAAAMAMAAGRFDEARRDVADAEKLDGDPAPVRELRQSIDAQDFDAGLREATTARDAARYADARTTVEKRLKPLNVDAARKAQLDPFLASIEGRERHDRYAAALANATRLLASQQYAAARDAAKQAADLASTDSERTQLQDVVSRADKQDALAKLLVDARQHLAAGRILEARAAVKQARAMNLPIAGLDDLDRQIAEREHEAAAKTPTPVPTPALPPAAGTSPRDDPQERSGLVAFFRGDYRTAANALGQVSDKDRPRARLYLAYAQAALALLETDAQKRTDLTQTARRTLDGVRAQLGALAADDTRYVSPSIVRLLNLDAAR